MTKLFSSWQLKTTVFALFLVSCFGHEQYVERRGTQVSIYGNGHLDGVKSRLLRDEPGQRYDIHERIYENKEARENHRLSEEARPNNFKLVEVRTITDVTRHLDNRFNDRVAISRSDDSHALRQLENRNYVSRESAYRDDISRRLINRDNERRSDENRGEQQNNLRRLSQSNIERDLNRRSENKREERQDHTRQIDVRDSTLRQVNDRVLNRDASRRSDVTREFQQTNEEIQRRFENRVEKGERYGNSERRDDQEAQQPIGRRSKYDYEERLGDFGKYADYTRMTEHERNSRSQRAVREPKQRSDRYILERDVSRNSGDNRREDFDNMKQITIREENRHLPTNLECNREEYQDTLRIFHDRDTRCVNRYSGNERGSQNTQERTNILKLSRELEHREAQREVINRDYNFRQLDDHKTLQEFSRRVENHIERDQIRYENNREGKERLENLKSTDTREVIGDLRRVERNHKDNYETLRRFDGNELMRRSNRALSDSQHLQRLERNKQNRESSGKSERTFLGERQNKHEERFDSFKLIDDREIEREFRRLFGREENKRERQERQETFRILDRAVRTEDNRREVQYDDRAVQRDVNRRVENDYSQGILRRFDNRETRLYGDERSDARENQRLNVKSFQRESVRESKQDQLERYETSRRAYAVRHNVRDSRESSHNDKRFIERISTRREDEIDESQDMRQRLYQRERNPSYRFIPSEGNSEAHYQDSRDPEDDYIQKPAVHLKNGYIVLGQTAVLAYIIVKTLKGNNDLKNHLPVKMRKVMEILCF